MHRCSGKGAGPDQVGLNPKSVNLMIRPTKASIVGALVGLTALLLIACGSESAEPAQVMPRVATSTPQPQADPPATSVPTSTPTPTVEPSLSDRLGAGSVVQPTQAADPVAQAPNPIPIATPLPEAESVVGSAVPSAQIDPEAQPDPPELGTPLINITLPRAASEEVVDLATFDSDKNIVIVFYRAFW